MADRTPAPARPERGRPESIEERITRFEEQCERIEKKVLLAVEQCERTAEIARLLLENLDGDREASR